MNISTYFGAFALAKRAQHKPLNSRKIFLLLAIITAISFSSCGNEHAEGNAVIESAGSTCFYSFKAENTATVKWTAFKTTAKVGVGGQFDETIVTAGEKSTKMTEVLETIKFTIKTASTNTTNEGRDKKIIDAFFGTMITTDLIIGQIKSAEGDNEKGTCIALVTLNDVESDVNLNYVVTDNVVTLTGEMDINNWNGQAALTALNEVCSEKHKGEDGESMTWPTVELNIEAVMTKNCH